MVQSGFFKKINILFIISLVLTIFSFVSLFLIIGYFNRPAWDDFEMLNYTKDLGVIGATLRFYLEWEGAFTPFFLQNLIIGKFFYNDGSIFGFAILSLIIYVFSFTILVYELLKNIFNNANICWFYVFAISMLYMGATYFITPDISWIWHWMVGSIAYLYSICLLFLSIAFLLRMKRTNRKIDFYIAVFTAFLFGATRFNLVSTVFGFAVLYFLSMIGFRKKIDKKYYFVFIAFSIGFIIYLAAPGNYVRQEKEFSLLGQEFTYLSELINVIPRVCKTIFFDKLPYLLVLLAPLLVIGYNIKQKINKNFIKSKNLIIILIIIFCILFIAVVANITTLYISIGKGDQTAKVWTLIIFMYSAAIALCYMLAGFLISKKYSIVLYTIAFLGLASSGYLYLKTIRIQYPIIKQYATAYDARINYIKLIKNQKFLKSGDTLFLEPLPSSGILKSAEILDFTDNYINRSIKKRYNLPFEVILKSDN